MAKCARCECSKSNKRQGRVRWRPCESRPYVGGGRGRSERSRRSRGLRRGRRDALREGGGKRRRPGPPGRTAPRPGGELAAAWALLAPGARRPAPGARRGPISPRRSRTGMTTVSATPVPLTGGAAPARPRKGAGRVVPVARFAASAAGARLTRRTALRDGDGGRHGRRGHGLHRQPSRAAYSPGGGRRIPARSGGTGVSGRKNGSKGPSWALAGASVSRNRSRRRP
jgi:hypothetical protein